MKIFDIAATEYDVLEHFIARRYRMVSRSVFCPEGSHFSQSDRRFIRIDSIQNTLISDFCLRYEAYFAPQIRDATTHFSE
jgi:hypothetical protein